MRDVSIPRRVVALWMGLAMFAPSLSADENALNKRIEADYDDISLERALDEFRDDTDASMVLSPELPLQSRVNIVVEKASARKILNWLCEQVGMGYTIDEGVILLAPLDEIEDRERIEFKKGVIAKRYYLGDLIGEIKDFRGPEISLAGGEEGGGGITIEESSSETDEPMTGDDLVDLIQSTIHPNRWDLDDYGTSIAIRNSSILVRTTSEFHDEIQDLVTEMRKARSRLIEVAVRVHEIPSEKIIGLMDSLDGLALNERGMQLLNTSKLRAMQTCIGHSNQRMTSNSLQQLAYVRDLTAVVNVATGLMDPDIGYIQKGMSVDVRATASHDAKTVLIENRISYSRLHEMTSKEVTNKIEGGERISSEGADVGKTKPLKISGEIDLPEVDFGAQRSTLRVPAGRWIPMIMSEREGKYLVLAIRCRVIDQ